MRMRWKFISKCFFILFQCGKHFFLYEQSLFRQNIHRLDRWGACSMTSYGQIKEVLLTQGDWITYAERLSCYFETNSITDTNRKKAVLLSVCGMGTFFLLKDLITPDSLQDKMFEELSQALDEHCNPALSIIIVKWFNFYMCWQQPNHFICPLKKIVKVLQIWSNYPGCVKGLAGCRCHGQLYQQTFTGRKKVEFWSG